MPTPFELSCLAREGPGGSSERGVQPNLSASDCAKVDGRTAWRRKAYLRRPPKCATLWHSSLEGHRRSLLILVVDTLGRILKSDHSPCNAVSTLNHPQSRSTEVFGGSLRLKGTLNRKASSESIDQRRRPIVRSRSHHLQRLPLLDSDRRPVLPCSGSAQFARPTVEFF
jgi:hypothetical protein